MAIGNINSSLCFVQYKSQLFEPIQILNTNTTAELKSLKF